MPLQSVLDSMDQRIVAHMNLVSHSASTSTAYNVRGVGCLIYNYGDGNGQHKIDAIVKGVTKLVEKGYTLPRQIKFVLSSRSEGWSKAPTEAFARNKRSDVEAKVFLGVNSYWKSGDPLVGSEGIAHKLERKKKGTYTTTVVVHEIGHLLHDIGSEDFFWSAEAKSPPQGNGGVELAHKYISPYAASNALEVVAETFCAHNMGYKLDWKKVLPMYNSFQGPALL